MSVHSATIDFEIGSVTYEASFNFDYTPGAEPTGPSYASGGDPGYGPEFDISNVVLRRPKDNDVLGELLATPPWLEADIIIYALEYCADYLERIAEEGWPDPDAARDFRRDDRAEMRR